MTTFEPGDLAQHPEHPGWIWEYAREHNNPRVGWWRLVFILKGAKWPRPHGVPEVGDLHELGYDTLDKLNEMEALALVSSD